MAHTWFAAAVFVVYAVTAQILAALLGEPAAVVSVSSAVAAFPVWAEVVALAFGLAGVAIALVVPTLAWISAFSMAHLRAAPLFHRAFAANLIQAVVFVGVWKAVDGIAPSRTVFIVWQALVTGVGMFVLLRARRRTIGPSRDRARLVVAGGLVLLLALPLLLWDKVVVEDGSDDGTEQFEFSRSLATNQLPYWDLENGFYGFYPSFMLFAYPTQLSFLAIGETEGGQRLPVFFFLFGIYLVLAELIRRRRRPLSWVELALLVGASATFLLYHVNHSTYELVADIAEPTGVDTFFTFLAAAAFYELTVRQRIWWGVFALFGAAALAAGTPFALLFLCGRVFARWPRFRWASLRGHVLDTLAFIVPLVIYQVVVAVYAYFYPLGSTKWSLDRIFDQYPLRIDPAVLGMVAENFAIFIAVVPLAGLALMVRRDRIARSLGFTILGYFATLVFFTRSNPHYLIPLCLFPAALYMRALVALDVGGRVRISGSVAYGAALSLLLVWSIPKDRSPHTTYRDFGAHTLMLYDSYPGLVQAAEHLVWNRPGIYLHLPNGKQLAENAPTLLALPPSDPRNDADYVEAAIEDVVRVSNPASTDTSPWGLTHHVWVRYADHAPVDGRRYHQVLAAAHLAPAAIDGFSRRELPDGWVLFYRPGESIFTWLGAAGS